MFNFSHKCMLITLYIRKI